MKNNKKATYLIISILFVLTSSCGTVGVKNGNFGDGKDWKLSPKGGVPGPRIVSTGSVRGIFIGHDDATNQDGSSNSKVTQTFKCGSKKGDWCTVKFMASNDQKDNEKIKVTLSSGPNKSKTGYIHKQIRLLEHKISVEGCGEVTLTFEMVGGTKNNLQSTAQINSVHSGCSLEEVNKNLMTIDGEPLE